jgi:N-acetylglucosaminyldiphosphoundecaprenol N-acetyl-beta-D-mannosaminyltransferase
MTFSIITPSYGQLEWLRLCVASVADQNQQLKQGSWKIEAGSLGADAPAAQGVHDGTQSPISNLQSPARSPLAIEHIIQDGGSTGIEEFAKGMGEELMSRYGGELVPDLQPFEHLHLRTASGYTLRIFKEPDAGMYDALNKGIAKMSGDLWAWINSDEQYLPGTLAYVAEWFEKHPDADILCGDALLTDEGGNAVSYRRIVRPLWRHTRLVHLASLSCASFYRRSIVERGGVFDTSWRSIGDAEWMARMMKAGVIVKACRRLLSTYAFTGENTSESPLAGEEGDRWRLANDAPSPWQVRPMIWLHRLRKFLAGAYRYRTVRYALHSFGGQGRVMREKCKVGWGWPTSVGYQSPAGGDKISASIGGKASTGKAISNQESIFSVLGTDLLATDNKGLAKLLIEAAGSCKEVLAVDFANTHIVTMRWHDPDFESLAERIDLTVPDGMPLVWAMNRKGAGLTDRVYGPTFTREFLTSCPEGMTHYLVGGSEECGRRFRERMLALNPSLNFIGGYHGPCSPEGILEDDAAVLAEIQEKKPDFIWVGLGTPKQYGWIARIKPELDHGVMLAVGFAFDVNAGMKPDAPAWMQRAGLTWLYRMGSEPRRLIGRYLKWNSLFLAYSLLDSGALQWSTMKPAVRNFGLRLIDLFASDITDCESGESLGRGLILGWGGRIKVIGHETLPPLIPRFLPQRRLTYWQQSIGFTTHRRPDYPRLSGLGGVSSGGTERVINVVLTHQGVEALSGVLKNWEGVCREEDLWIAFGGSRADFEKLGYPRKIFVEDPALRTRDHQREKQSYTGIYTAMAAVVERERPDFIYLCEYDQIPLVRDLNRRQVGEMTREGADVMGHWLHRVDGTSHCHMLNHETDPGFLPFWTSLSRREDPGVVFSMFGSGSFWTREAFLAVASTPQSIDCYQELYLPTLAHHLGYRVLGWNEEHHLLSNLPSRTITVQEGRKRGAWTVHPVKG